MEEKDSLHEIGKMSTKLLLWMRTYMKSNLLATHDNML